MLFHGNAASEPVACECFYLCSVSDLSGTVRIIDMVLLPCTLDAELWPDDRIVIID